MDDRLDLSSYSLEDFTDPLNRIQGETIDPVRISSEELLILQRASPRLFAALYRQDPRATGGKLINPKWFVEVSPTDIPDSSKMRTVRFYDLAYSQKQISKSNPDYTATCKLSLWKNGSALYLVLWHIARWQAAWPVTKRKIVELAHEDGPKVKIGVEANGPQKAAYQELLSLKELRGFRVVGDNPVQDKVARAQHWIDFAETGKFLVVYSPQLSSFYDECEIFDAGRYDDQIDAVSGATNLLKPHMNSRSISTIKVSGLYGI